MSLLNKSYVCLIVGSVSDILLLLCGLGRCHVGQIPDTGQSRLLSRLHGIEQHGLRSRLLLRLVVVTGPLDLIRLL